MSKAQIYVDHVGKPEDPIRLEIIVLFLCTNKNISFSYFGWCLTNYGGIQEKSHYVSLMYQVLAFLTCA